MTRRSFIALLATILTCGGLFKAGRTSKTTHAEPVTPILPHIEPDFVSVDDESWIQFTVNKGQDWPRPVFRQNPGGKDTK